jgi:rhodanese-related sulfurtransferase
MSDLTTDLTTAGGLAEHLDEVQIVDCREPYEWQAGRIEGSIHIPLNSILAGATGQLDGSKTTVVVCRSGNRSELATHMLRARGFEAYNLERGLEEWEREGRPLSTPDGQPGHVA